MLRTHTANCCGLLRSEYGCNSQLLWPRYFLQILLLLKECHDR